MEGLGKQCQIVRHCSWVTGSIKLARNVSEWDARRSTEDGQPRTSHSASRAIVKPKVPIS